MTPRIRGRCGHCGHLVWSDQRVVRWEGIVLLHKRCWSGPAEEVVA